MEIDFSDLKFQHQGFVIAGIVILATLLLGVLGWYLTPQGQVLTWTEWQVYKQHNQYQREMRVLTRHADRLATLLEKPPDPVRAQLSVEQLRHDLETQVDLVTLAKPENALLQAGDAILQWALGSAEKNNAIEWLDAANEAIVIALDQVSE